MLHRLHNKQSDKMNQAVAFVQTQLRYVSNM